MNLWFFKKWYFYLIFIFLLFVLHTTSNIKLSQIDSFFIGYIVGVFFITIGIIIFFKWVICHIKWTTQ